MDILRLGYGYDFIQGSNYIVGASIGLHTMFVKTEFEGDIGICVPNTNLAQYCDDIIRTEPGGLHHFLAQRLRWVFQ